MSDTSPPSPPEPGPTAPTLPPAPADTEGVSGAPPARSKGPIWIIVGAVLGIAIIVAIIALTRPTPESAASPTAPVGAAPTGVPTGAGQTYSDNGVTFQYPVGWIHGPSILTREVGTKLWSETFAPKAYDPNGVVVTEYTLQQDLSQIPASPLEAQLKQMVTTSLGGQNVSDVTPVTVGTLTGYQVTFDAEANDTQFAVQLTMLFVGLQQFNINCQTTSSSSADIQAGCQQIMSTFRLTESSPTP
jgi:hypothetical protein